MAHPNEALFRRLLDTWSSGDRDAAAGFFAEDATFSYPGPGPLHGDHRGRDGILRFWADQDRHSGGRFQAELIDLVASDRHIFILMRIGGGDSAWSRVVIYAVAEGVVVTARVFEDDPAAAETFFSQGA